MVYTDFHELFWCGFVLLISFFLVLPDLKKKTGCSTFRVRHDSIASLLGLSCGQVLLVLTHRQDCHLFFNLTVLINFYFILNLFFYV